MKAAHVLVVDDNATNRLLLVKTVEAFGATADTAENGQQALEKMAAADAGFDLVFMDIAMPVLDGLEATKRARAAGSVLPIVAVTAHYGRGDYEELDEAGFTGLIPKPFDLNAVFETLQSLPA